ncbi:MAG: WD40 repeat domain-containing protein, partial [Cyanobacteria bacterium P01_E01_bin.42]
GSDDKTVKIWDMRKSSFPFILKNREEVLFNMNSNVRENTSIEDIVFDPNGPIIISVNRFDGFDWDYGIKKYRARIWLNKNVIDQVDNSNNFSISSDSKNRLLVSSKQSKIIQILHTNGQFLKRIQKYYFNSNSQDLAIVDLDNSVEVWNNKTQMFNHIKKYRKKINFVKFSRDINMIIIVTQDNIIEIRKKDGTLVANIPTKNGVIQNISTNLDVTLIAIKNLDGIIQLLKRDGTVIKTIRGTKGKIPNMDFSSDGKTLIILGNENTVEFIQKDGTLKKVVKSRLPLKIDFSPNKEIVVIRNQSEPNDPENEIQIWNSNGEYLSTLKFDNLNREDYLMHQYLNISFLNNSQLILLQSFGRSFVFDLQGELIPSLSKIPIHDSNFNTIVTTEGKNNIKVWQRRGKSKVLLNNFQIKNREVNFLTQSFIQQLSLNGKILAIQIDDSKIGLWRIDGEQLTIIEGVADNNIKRYSFQYPQSQPSRRIPSKLIGDEFFIIRNQENQIQIWDIENEKFIEISPEKFRGNWINRIESFSGTGIFALHGGEDTVNMWQFNADGKKGIKYKKNLRKHRSVITDIEISPNNQIIASASLDKTVNLWDSDGNFIKTVEKHTEGVNTIAFSPDERYNQWIASGSDDTTVKLWKASDSSNDGTFIKSFEEHGNGVTDISFSPDGKLIASASKDNTVKLWNPENGKVSVTLSHNYPVLRVTFHPEKKLIATATDKNITLWNYDGVLIKEYQRLGSHDVEFTPDGKSISAGGNNYIPIWDFDLDRLIEKGCNWARDYLKNNINVEKRDRNLCDGIGDE